ncbi:DUF4388 domain-containing protein [Deinococcus koreensis]|uniref:DUF4388 domain-containing protein n=1 Tax=Deinococcus koreensis TaxID=2054903 RepID=UPI0013FDB328|nr:DUF4388 domain-containing protein [Deinococcus koreensis]
MTGAPPSHPTILSGLLLPGDNSLPMLLDYLHQCERNGALLIHTAHGPAHLYFQAGQLLHAQFQGHAGLPAIAVLMQVQDQAAFTFQLNRDSPERSITTTLGHLLMNAAQILDEGHAPPLDLTPATTAPPGAPAPAAPATGTYAPPPAGPPDEAPVSPTPAAPGEPEITYDLVPALLFSAEQLGAGSDAHRRLLRAVNARRSVADLARHSGLSLDEVTRLLRLHLTRGEVTLGPPLLHQKFWIELLRLTNTVAGKEGDQIIQDALKRIGAAPGAIPVGRGRAFLKTVEQGVGEAGSARRVAFSRGCYQLRMMILNATNTTEEDWNEPDVR